jgi:polar amino acid transport system substrate-binding protein
MSFLVRVRAHAFGLGCVLAALALALAATATGSTETSGAIPGCTPGTLALKTPGQLTLATDNPAARPWWNGTPVAPWKKANPASGTGLESALAYAVAKRLGFPKRKVTWLPLSVVQATQPGTKPFDVYLGQVTYTPARNRDVDFSNGYYSVPQALLTRAEWPVAGVRRIAHLSHTYLGAPVGSVSMRYIERHIRPRVGPMYYDTYETALPALERGVQIKGIVVDLPTAYRYRSRIANGMIVGHFPLKKSRERFAMVFEQGSPLRRCVNKALSQLQANGTVKKLQNRWLTPAGGGRLIR